MTILLSDPAVHGIPVHECDEPLVTLDPAFGTGSASTRLVRLGLATRLGAARAALPAGYQLRVVEGFRSPEDQRAIIASYDAELRRLHPTLDPERRRRLTSRYVAPLAVAPHVAGAAVDLTLTDADGADLPMGCALDATPEQSHGACFFDAPGLTRAARRHRSILARALGGAGLVNYPTEWWHWSFGDRYWALTTGASAAVYGPAGLPVAA